MNSIELRQERARVWDAMQKLNAGAMEEQRSLTAEEQEQWDRMNAELDRLAELIGKEERAEEERGRIAVSDAIAEHDVPAKQSEAAYRDAFRAYLVGGMGELGPEQRTLLRKGHTSLSGAETRALGVGAGPTGGFTVPDESMAPIVEAMEAFGGIRASRATVRTTNSGADWPVPMNNDVDNEGVRIGENQAVGEQDVEFGQKVLRAYMYTSRIIRVPYQFLQDTSIADFESWLGRVFGDRIGRITNREFTEGLGGGNEPEGLLTASVLGATTGAADVITYDDLVELEHSVDPAYRIGAEWMLHDQTLKELKQLTDGMGRPLWVPGVAVREPDTILGYRYVVNQHFPSPAWASGDRAIAFGDMSYYWVRDVRGVTVVRLDERYADNLQVGFLAFSRHDGALVDAGTHPIRHLAML